MILFPEAKADRGWLLHLRAANTKYEMLTQDLFFLLRHKNGSLATSLWPWRSGLECVFLMLSKALKTFLNFALMGLQRIPSWYSRFAPCLQSLKRFISSVMNFRTKKEFPLENKLLYLLSSSGTILNALTSMGIFSFVVCRFWIWVAAVLREAESA